MLPAITVIVFLLMLGELWYSRRNERRLRAKGAVEPDDDVYRIMAWAYPASFLAMAVEGVVVGPAPPLLSAAGVLTFVAAKAIKYWAIATLGPRWTFRVLVLPGAPLVTHGPYAWLRHPNYVGVIGELFGFALMTGAGMSGLASVAGFAWLLRRRIAAEDRALGRDHPSGRGV